LLLPALAVGQQSQSLVLRPKVYPPAVPEVTASCPECQPHADEHNRIAGQINALNRELAFRRREVDLQQQAIDLVSAELASLQAQPASAERDARIKFARERLEAYRAQLVAELAKVAALERRVAELERQLAVAKARLQACEAACASTTQEPQAEPPPPEPPPAEPPPPQEIPADVRLDLRALRDELTLSEEELEQRRRESEQFEANLKSMAGDQWAAEFAAFFTSTLFDPDTPFDTAYLQNMKTILQISDEKTPEQRAAQSALALQNATVAARQAAQQRAANESTGRQIEYSYTREARGLIGPGYPDLPTAGENHKTAALMTQDAHMAQLLQFRAGLNTIKIGDGTVTIGGFTSQAGQATFIRLGQINQEIGTLRANGGDADRIAALESERATLLTIDGLAPSDGLLAARAGLVDGLAGLAPSVYEAYWNWIGVKEGGLPEKYYKLPTREAAAQYQAEVAQYERIYLSALGQSPFLSAMVDPAGSGDPIPFWQYLTSTESPWEGGRRPSSYAFVATGARDPAQDQTALTQAIDFLDQASMQVIDQFGTIVTTVPLMDAYGSPVFAPLRSQVITDLTPFYPQVAVHMGHLTSLYDANFANTALSRTATDVALGFTQIGVGVLIAGSIVFFPPATPGLVTIEVGLTVGQVGMQGFRTYYAWQDLQRAEQAASAGAGASYVGTLPYRDLFDDEFRTLIFVIMVAPVSFAGSAMSLNLAKASEIAAFKALRPDEQVAMIKSLPAEARPQYVSQLGRTEKELFALAWEKQAMDTQFVASVRKDGFWLEWRNGDWQPVSDATRNATDQEILDRLAPFASETDRIRMDPVARDQYFDDLLGTDDIGPFSDVPPQGPKYGIGEGGWGIGTFPEPGYYTSQMSQAEIDALLAKTGPLTPKEVALKADLLLRHGKSQQALPGWSAPLDPNWNPFNPFASPYDTGTGTIANAVDDLSGATEAIPGRPRNPNRTALLEEPDLPPETLILDPFIPPAAGLLDFPFDLSRLLTGDPLPITFWRQGTPHALRQPRPLELGPPPQTPATVDVLPETPSVVNVQQDAPTSTTAVDDALDDSTVVNAPPLGTIVHVEAPVTPVTPRAIPTTPPAWLPFVINMFPIGCRFAPGATPDCNAPTYVFVLQYPPGSAGAIGTVVPATPGYVYGEGDESRRVQAADPYLGSRGSWGQPYDDQWALKQIGLESAAASGNAGATVTVAVIDTGVAWNHKDLGPGNLWVNPGERPANGKDDDGNGYVDDIVGWNFVDRNNLPWDFNGHGTLVAGIIAAGRDNGVGIAGINPRARIMVLKAMDERGRGAASAIAEAIVYAASNGARVINLSLGGRRLTRTEYLAIEFAHSRGTVVVAAAGNEGVELDDYGPGGVPRALTVTATDTADRRVKESNFGADIDLAAPGVDVLGPRAIGTDLLAAAGARDYRRGDHAVGPDAGYIRATGTSFAAPLVAGAASLLFAANPSLSAAQVERMLLHSARDIEAPGVDQLSGYGRLDVAAALAADPAFYVDASIARVEVAQGAKGPVARVIGSADADRFAGARLEIGAGERPTAWKAVEGGPSKPVRDGVLAEVPAAAFGGSAVWTVRIIASHANGRTREARYLLRLN
jgi:subtilisin family serine protease